MDMDVHVRTYIYVYNIPISHMKTLSLSTLLMENKKVN